MTREGRSGKEWAEDELDVIVADYFEMLDAEVARRPYIKSRHNAGLMKRTGRSHASVEFKYQNISAVLEEMGLPWIMGYRPRKNYQRAIFGAIDRYLSRRPGTLDFVPADKTATSVALDVFVDPPQLTPSEALPTGLRRLIGKFDAVQRDYRNRSLGQAGEAFVLGVERRRLAACGRNDLATNVRWVAVEDGDGAGYDILSFEPELGHERLIEVKTTNGSARTPFFLSRNERDLSVEQPDRWRIYRVHLFATEPRIFTLAPPLDQAVDLRPETWRASF